MSCALCEKVLPRHSLFYLPETQRCFDQWRAVYNEVRPREALDQEPPQQRYQASPRPFPEKLPPLSYDVDFQVRYADASGRISFLVGDYRVGKAFAFQYVGLRPTLPEGLYEVYFCHQKLTELNTRDPPT